MNKFSRTLLLTTLFSITTQPLFAGLLGIFPDGQKPNFFLFLTVLISAFLIAIAVHELGHLITGMAQGFRFELFVVGPLGIKREEGKIKMYLNKSIAMMGGVAATLPTVQHPDNRKKFARLLLAGPLTSLVYGLISIGIAYFCIPIVALFFYTTGACSLSLCLATTLPSTTGIYFTDRKRYQRMTSKGKEGDSEEALLQIIAQSISDGHHKNIAVHNAITLQQDDTSFMKFWGYYYEHLYYKENEIVEKTSETKAVLLANQSLVSKQIWKALKIEGEVLGG